MPTQQAEAKAQRQGAAQLFLSWTERVGGTTRPADGEASAFDDTDVAVPLQAAAEWCVVGGCGRDPSCAS